jgi:elongation factor Ts
LAVTVESIKTLRAQTGAGIMDCKRALEQAEGDMQRAGEILREQGIASAAKKATRATNQGLIESYVHSGGRIAAIVEVNCETDFVARTSDFRRLAHDLAMQVAAMSPLFIDGDDVPDGEEGNAQEACLMLQPFIKDPTMSVRDLVNESVGKLGENVRIRRFARFALGE